MRLAGGKQCLVSQIQQGATKPFRRALGLVYKYRICACNTCNRAWIQVPVSQPLIDALRQIAVMDNDRARA